MFLISTLIREIGAEAASKDGAVKQLFLLTHNAFFYREVTQGSKKFRGMARHWIIRKQNGVSTIERFGSQNPIQTTYQLLWNELKESKRNGYAVGIQNAVRRILEWYFGFLGGKNWELDLLDLFEGTEKTLLSSLLRWSNRGSHASFEDVDVYPSNEETERYLMILKNAFDKSGHLAHYEMMMDEESHERT